MGQTLVRGLPRRLLVALGLSICIPTVIPAWSAASAQVASIPDELVTSARALTPVEVAQIDTFVTECVRDLTGPDPELAGAARNRLLVPLEQDAIGVPFRLAYSSVLCAQLEPLAGDEREFVAINALRLLGEVATDRATNSLEPALDHPSLGIRYTAVYSLGRTFEAVASNSPAVAPQRVLALVDRLAEFIRNEPEPWILERTVRTMIAAGGIDKANFEGVRERAYSELTAAVSDRVRGLPMEEDGIDRLYFLLRSSVAARDALTGERSLSADAAARAAALGGDIFMFAAARLQRGEIALDERALLTSLGTSSQAVIHFARSAIDPNNQDGPPRPMPDLTEQSRDGAWANDEAFRRAAIEEIDRLYREPFEFADGRFDRP